jgi:predicted amidohydrolase
MDDSIRVSAIQFAPRQMDRRAENMETILSDIRKEAEAGSRLIVFPEVSVTGFFRHEPGGFQAFWEQGAIDLDGPEIQRICAIAEELGIHTVVGFAERSPQSGRIFNSAALIGPKGVSGVTRKIHLPGLEKLYFSPGERIDVFSCELGRIGVAICYDALFPEYIGALSRQGVDIIVFSSSFWAGGAKGGVGDEDSKKKLLSALPMVTAIQNQAFVISCNACGREDMGSQAGTWERLGLSQIATPSGDILAAAGESSAETISAFLKQESLIGARTTYRFLADRAGV